MNTDKLSEYKVLKLKYLEEDDPKDSHEVFVKRYRSSIKSADKPIGKTLLVTNLPPYASEESLKSVFSIAGDVEKVVLLENYEQSSARKYEIPSKYFNEQRSCKFMIGFVVFKKSSSLDMVFTLKDLPALCSSESEQLNGIKKWVDAYNKRVGIDSEDMQRDIDEYMKHYDKVKDRAETENNADDDGWIQVGKKGHYAGFKQNEAVVHKLEQKLENRRKKAKLNLQQVTGLYAFGTREYKKQELLELKKKFEEDKTKLQSMRHNRKFKPY